MKKEFILSVALTVSVFVVMVFGSYAWYDYLVQSSSVESAIQSDSHLVALSEYTIFMSYDAEPSPEDGSLSLISYDSVFGRNDKTPAYVLVSVEGLAVEEKGHNLAFTFDYSDTPLTDEEGKIAKFLSNVVQIRYQVVDSGEVSGLTYDLLYEKFHSEQEPQPEKICYASYSVDDDGNLTTSSKEKITIMPDYSETDRLYVVFELDYNRDLVESFLNNHFTEMSGRLDNTQTLEFSNVLQRLLLRQTKGGKATDEESVNKIMHRHVLLPDAADCGCSIITGMV